MIETGKKRKLEEYFDDETVNTVETEISKEISKEISNAWDAINASQEGEEVEDGAETVTSEKLAKKGSDDEAKEVEEEDYEKDNDDDLIQPLKKRRTETNTTETVFKVPSESASGQIKYSQQAVYKKLNEDKLSKFMESSIGACKSETEDVTASIFSKAASTAAKSCDESVDSQSIYSEHFEDDEEKTVDSGSDTPKRGDESIQSKDEYITLRKRTDGQIERIVNAVTTSNIADLNKKFADIIEKYKKDRESKNITLLELEEDYSKVFGNLGILFYKYKEDKSNLHNAFFPTLLGKEVNLDDHTFERIYKKQMVLDLCLFVYNLNLFETIRKPYTYITYNFVAIDDGTKSGSAAFSIASTKSNRDAIKIVKGCKPICKGDESNPLGTEVCTTGPDYDCSQLTTSDSGSGSDSDGELEGGKKSKSNQGGKKGPNKGPNKGLKKNHKTNKKRSNRSFMVKGKKTKPRKTQRKKNKKKKTQRKKFAVKKDIKKKTKRVRFNL